MQVVLVMRGLLDMLPAAVMFMAFKVNFVQKEIPELVGNLNLTLGAKPHLMVRRVVDLAVLQETLVLQVLQVLQERRVVPLPCSL